MTLSPDATVPEKVTVVVRESYFFQRVRRCGHTLHPARPLWYEIPNQHSGNCDIYGSLLRPLSLLQLAWTEFAPT